MGGAELAKGRHEERRRLERDCRSAPDRRWRAGQERPRQQRDQNGTMGLLVTLEPPTGPMRKEAVQEGSYRSEAWNRDYPRVQILTVEELLHGVKPDVPPSRSTFSSATRISTTPRRKFSQIDLFGL
jgi:hypothetical protein